MKMKIVVLLMAVLSLAAFSRRAAAAGPDPKFWIFLCFGQSNMEGYPGVEQQDKTVDPRFQMLATVDDAKLNRKKGQWYPAAAPLCRGDTGLCPADYFGRTMLLNVPKDVRIGVVNVAVAGCKIEMFMTEKDATGKETYKTYSATAASWMQNIIKKYDGNPYQYLVDMGKLAQKDGVIKGILLHQGESNTNDKEWSKKVKGIYDGLIKDLDLQAANTPLLAGELVNADQKGACASMNSLIDLLPKTLDNSYVVSSKGCACRQQDHLHFTPVGYRELGTRYAEALLPVMGFKGPFVRPEATAAATQPAAASTKTP